MQRARGGDRQAERGRGPGRKISERREARVGPKRVGEPKRPWEQWPGGAGADRLWHSQASGLSAWQGFISTRPERHLRAAGWRLSDERR